MKTINVVCAIIKEENKIFVTQRGYGDYKDWWEFPGGKIEEGETEEQALKREIKEELNASIEVDKYLCTSIYDYPKFHLIMKAYLCHLNNPHIELLEHENAKWIDIENLSYDGFLEADKVVIDAIKEALN